MLQGIIIIVYLSESRKRDPEQRNASKTHDITQIKNIIMKYTDDAIEFEMCKTTCRNRFVVYLNSTRRINLRQDIFWLRILLICQFALSFTRIIFFFIIIPHNFCSSSSYYMYKGFCTAYIFIRSFRDGVLGLWKFNIHGFFF